MIWLISQMWVLLLSALAVGIYIGFRIKPPEKILVVAEQENAALGTLENDGPTE